MADINAKWVKIAHAEQRKDMSDPFVFDRVLSRLENGVDNEGDYSGVPRKRDDEPTGA